jgi:hypothetical protein
MIFTIIAQCRSKEMITPSVVTTVWKQRYTQQKQKSGHHCTYLDSVCVLCVFSTSSSGGLPSDAIPIAGRIHPPHACNVIPPRQTPHQPLPGEMLADVYPLSNVDGTATANLVVTIPWSPSDIPPGASLCDT